MRKPPHDPGSQVLRPSPPESDAVRADLERAVAANDRKIATMISLSQPSRGA